MTQQNLAAARPAQDDPGRSDPAEPEPTEQERLDLADDIGQQLVRFVRLLHGIDARSPELAGSELDRSGYALLAHLILGGPRRSGALADAVHVDPSTVSRQVAALTEHGLVARRPDPRDGRAQVLAATPRGREVFERCRRRRNEQLARILARWSGADCRRLGQLLRRFTDDVAAYQAATSSPAGPSAAAPQPAPPVATASDSAAPRRAGHRAAIPLPYASGRPDRS